MDQQDLPTGLSGSAKANPVADEGANEPDGNHGETERLKDALAAAEARERALSHELQHRVRNMLAVIRSIFRRSRENGASQDEFAEHFEGRLRAVARYQAHVDEVGPGTEIEDMVRDELLESTCLDGPRCTIVGPASRLRQKAAELMGLTIHELATNSIKFGALAQDGHLLVTWSIERHDEVRRLRFVWIETGVSVASAAPRPSGFGRQLIEEALPYQLGATTSFELKPGGLACTILLPIHEPCDAEPEGTIAGDLLPAETESLG